MSSHPANLALRFVLELCGLTALGFWGFQQAEGSERYTFAIGIPIIAALIWATFGVAKDPSRGKNPAVRIPGTLRLGLETLFFAFAVWALFDLAEPLLGWILGLAIASHYLFSYERLIWLVRQ